MLLGRPPFNVAVVVVCCDCLRFRSKNFFVLDVEVPGMVVVPLCLTSVVLFVGVLFVVGTCGCAADLLAASEPVNQLRQFVADFEPLLLLLLLPV